MTKLQQKLVTRLPSAQQIGPVFSIITFIVFSWTFLQLFRQVPSWIFYMNVWKLFVMFAYVLSFSLVESTLLLVFLLFVCLVFPVHYFKDKFIAQGSAQVVLISAITLSLHQWIDSFQKLDLWILITIPILTFALVLIFVVVFSKVFDRFQILARFFNAIADRMTIFTVIYVPFGLVGSAVVIWRNLF